MLRSMYKLLSIIKNEMKPKPNMTPAEKAAYNEYLDRLEAEGGCEAGKLPKSDKSKKKDK